MRPTGRFRERLDGYLIDGCWDCLRGYVQALIDAGLFTEGDLGDWLRKGVGDVEGR